MLNVGTSHWLISIWFGAIWKSKRRPNIMIIFKKIKINAATSCCLCFTFLRSAAGGNAEIHRLVYLRNNYKAGWARNRNAPSKLKLDNPNPKET